MGLFFKRESDTERAPLYTMGHQSVALVVGLGNVGKEYTGTRHNIGFECVDNFAAAQDFPKWLEKKDLKCLITKHVIAGKTVILMKPTTYMNESGQAVQAVQHFYKIPQSDTLVVHDELDIPFGQIRTRSGGSDAGNNGIKSIIQHLGEDFARLRIGIKSAQAAKMDGANFVLSKFSGPEQKKLPLIIREATSLINEFLATNSLPNETRKI